MNKSYLLIMLLITQMVLLCIQLLDFRSVNAILLAIPEIMIWAISYYILKKYK